MFSNEIFKILLITQFSVAIGIFVILRFISAPYGKHNRRGWGITIQSKYAWLIMEIPAVVIMALVYILNFKSFN
ncbi:hypothetical protein ACFLSY_10970, partial [Bacteroidota bacterium]